jgi:anti-anti-sigma regulatory factor
MPITTTHAEGLATITVEGGLLIGGVADGKPAIVAALAAAGEILLDLDGIDGCDTAGIQLLLMIRASARIQGKRLTTTPLSGAFQTALARRGIPLSCFE